MPAADSKSSAAEGDASRGGRKPSSIYRWLVVKLVRRRLLHPVPTPSALFNSTLAENNLHPNVVISVPSPTISTHSSKPTHHFRNVECYDTLSRISNSETICRSRQHQNSRPRPKSRSLRRCNRSLTYDLQFESSAAEQREDSAANSETQSNDNNHSNDDVAVCDSQSVKSDGTSTSTDPDYGETSYDVFSASLNSVYPSSYCSPPILCKTTNTEYDRDSSMPSSHHSYSKTSLETDPSDETHKNSICLSPISIYSKLSSEDASFIPSSSQDPHLFSMRYNVQEYDRESISSKISLDAQNNLRSSELCLPFYSSTPVIESRRFTCVSHSSEISHPESLPDVRHQSNILPVGSTKCRPIFTVVDRPSVSRTDEAEFWQHNGPNVQQFDDHLFLDRNSRQHPGANSIIPLKTPVSRLLERENIHKPVSVRSLETPTGGQALVLPRVRKWDSIGVLYGNEFLMIRQKVHQRLLCILRERRKIKAQRNPGYESSENENQIISVPVNRWSPSLGSCVHVSNAQRNCGNNVADDSNGAVLSQSFTQDSFISKSLSYQQVTEWKSCSNTHELPPQYASFSLHSPSFISTGHNCKRNVSTNNKSTGYSVGHSIKSSSKISTTRTLRFKEDCYNRTKISQDIDSDVETSTFSCCPFFCRPRYFIKKRHSTRKW